MSPPTASPWRGCPPGSGTIILAKGSYHGSHFWCQPHGAGIPEEWKTHIHYIDYNDPADLKSVVEANKGKIAGDHADAAPP